MGSAMNAFDYDQAFSRNIGWVTREEQEALRHKRVAIGGLGGVGGSHLIVLSRLGIGAFNIADLDDFDLPNFNRQYGASMDTWGQPKAEVMEKVIRGINPQLDIRTFKGGISLKNLDDFLDGVDIYVDSLDIFALEIRRAVFARCHEKGIPTITAAPMGMGTAFLVFMPGKMSFEEYFCLDGYSFEDQIIKFVIGVSPSVQQRKYLVDRSSVNFLHKKVPSTAMGIEIAAGVACTNVLKVLLGRGEVITAPRGLHFDAYRNRLIKTWRPFGNRNPLQRFMFWYVKRLLEQVNS
jgi:molybdopterin/thiamine biosynthesis adenylyltransferase